MTKQANYYVCPNCGHEWELYCYDTAHNDKCSSCGKDNEPDATIPLALESLTAWHRVIYDAVERMFKYCGVEEDTLKNLLKEQVREKRAGDLSPDKSTV